MASLTDHRLVQQAAQGTSEALGQLFDRYGGSVYDFLARVIGDADQAAHLLIDVFTRFPQAASEIPEHESVRGTLFSLAREIALSYLRQRGWLESLPPSASNSRISDLSNDIWQAARALPASQRAALAIEEHHALSPMEKAAALGVVRHALPDVIAEARHSFNYHFDLRAKAEGKPTSALINADRMLGLQRRVPDPEASLFAFLPPFNLSQTRRAQLRSQIIAAVSQPRGASVSPRQSARVPTQPMKPASENQRSPITLWIGIGVLVVLVMAMIAVLAFREGQPANDTLSPVVKQVEPVDGSLLPPGKRVVIQAIYSDDYKVDVKTVRFVLDGRDITLASTVSDTSISYEAELGSGQHIALVELKDSSGNQISHTWKFTVIGLTVTTTPLPTLTLAPSTTPVPTITPAPTATPAPTLTRIPSATLAPTWTPVPTATHTPTATRTLEPALPDLIVTDISLSPNAEIIYVIRNSGKGDVTRAFLIQVSVDNVIVDSNRKVSALGAGQEVSLFVPNYTLTGTHTVTVVVNSDQAVQESNYGNDELIRTLSGPKPTETPTPTPTRQ